MSGKCDCNRWAFSLQKAFESEHVIERIERHYRKALQCVTVEDYQKVTCYRYKDDSLACLAGRLFLRQAVKKLTGVPWHEIEFARTERGKPYVVRPEDINIGLNVSHQGDYTAFASSCSGRIGVDVMRLDKCRGNKTADEYINSMAEAASAEELRTMRSQATEQMKMTVFYRYWCLKEAVLKATGEGLVNDLSRYDFRIDSKERYRPVLEDGKPQTHWLFEESFVDNNHSIAVCREKGLPKKCVFHSDPEARLFFTKIDFDFLLDGATVLNPLKNDAAEEYDNFAQKPRKNF